MRADDPRHGTNAGYVAGCREGCCSDARRRDSKERELHNLRHGSCRIPHEQVAAELAPWFAMGLTLNAILAAADRTRSGSIFRAFRLGRPVNRATFRALKSVTEETLPPTAKVYAHLTRQRIYSLMAAGHRLEDMPVNARGQWRYRDHVTVALARAVRDYYAAHEFELGPSRHTQSRARNAGHLPPLAWDDPGTLAWTDADRRKRPRQRAATIALDEVVVARLLAGDTVRATKAERDEAMRRWLAMGRSERSLCVMHGWKDGRYGREQVAS